MKRGIVLQQITPSLDRHCLHRTSYLQTDIDIYRHHGPDINVLSVGIEPLTADREVIRVKWNVRDAESSRVVCHRGSPKPTDGITNFDGCIRNHCAARVYNDTDHQRRASARLRLRNMGES